MLRRLLLPLVLAGALLVVAASGYAASGKSAGLVGEVGPGFSIELTLNGKDVKTLKAGTYRLKVEDRSTRHDFHLIGKGLNRATTVAFMGEQTWRVTFKPGKVTYQCDPHAAAGMKGSFRVTG